MRVHVDHDACSGSATCARLLPEIFRIVRVGMDDVAEVIPGGAASDDELWNAAKSCPWAAILLEDDDGTPLYP